MKLKDFQDQFQRAILAGDDTILSHIADGARETKANLLGVYQDAYVLRLIEVVGNDHELLRGYLGEDAFGKMARAYIASSPSHSPNARWFSRGLPDFLRCDERHAQHPVVAELAALERTLNDAFDGADAPVLTLADLTAFPAREWAELSFTPHPTCGRLDVATNVADIWRALKRGDDPPPVAVRRELVRIIVWRHGTMPMFREMSAEEAMVWQEAAKGESFGTLCEMLAVCDDPPSAAVRAAGYLKGWLEGGLLSAVAVRAYSTR